MRSRPLIRTIASAMCIALLAVLVAPSASAEGPARKSLVPAVTSSGEGSERHEHGDDPRSSDPVHQTCDVQSENPAERSSECNPEPPACDLELCTPEPPGCPDNHDCEPEPEPACTHDDDDPPPPHTDYEYVAPQSQQSLLDAATSSESARLRSVAPMLATPGVDLVGGTPTAAPTGEPDGPAGEPDGPDGPTAIVGGEDAPDGEYPFMVSLQAVSSRTNPGDFFTIPPDWGEWGTIATCNPLLDHRCGATVIAPTWLITAAHCIDMRYVVSLGGGPIAIRQQWRYDALIGTTQLTDSGPNVERIPITAHIAHPEYEGMILPPLVLAYDHDIALLKLAWPTSAPPVTILGVNGQEQLDGQLLGWGHTSDSGTVNDDLQHVSVPMTDPATCPPATTVICFAPDDGTLAGGCQSDSGGPALAQDSNSGDWQLMGVTSYSSAGGCGNSTGYTNLGLYWEWILCTTGVMVQFPGPTPWSLPC